MPLSGEITQLNSKEYGPLALLGNRKKTSYLFTFHFENMQEITPGFSQQSQDLSSALLPIPEPYPL
jgi:hypothetical protein